MVTGRKTLVVSVFAFLVATTMSVAQEATVVTERNGELREQTGIRITKDQYDGIEGRKGAGRMTWKAPQVVEIRWKVAPADYKKALNLYTDGDYGQAAQLFKAALAKPGNYTWLPAYANYYLGRSAIRAGFAKEAVAAFEALVKDNAKHRFVPNAHLELAEIHTRPGSTDLNAAKASLQRAAKLSAVMGSDYQVQVDLGLARLEVRAGDATKGLNILVALERKTREESLLNLIAMVKGEAYVKMKQFGKAETAFKKILDSKKVKSPEVIAGAANGLGDCQFEQQKYEDAMWSYSRTYALFIDRDDLRREVGWALYRGGESFHLHAGKVDAEERKKWQRYGTRVLRRAATDFRNTRGGKLAREKLGLSN